MICISADEPKHIKKEHKERVSALIRIKAQMLNITLRNITMHQITLHHITLIQIK